MVKDVCLLVGGFGRDALRRSQSRQTAKNETCNCSPVLPLLGARADTPAALFLSTLHQATRRKRSPTSPAVHAGMIASGSLSSRYRELVLANVWRTRT